MLSGGRAGLGRCFALCRFHFIAGALTREETRALSRSAAIPTDGVANSGNG
jgi:hypothetical protein